MNEFNNLGDIYFFVLLMLGKDIEGAYLSPEEFTLLGNEVQLEFVNDNISVFEVNRDISVDLIPITKTRGDNEFPPLVLDSYGKTPFPDDMIYPARSNYLQHYNTNCTSTSLYRSITLLSQADFDEQMQDDMTNPLLNPKETFPIAVVQNGQLMVVPNVKKIALTYLRKPTSINFDYDEINGVVVYLPPGSVHVNDISGHAVGSPSESVEFEWRANVLPDMAQRIIRKAAINIRANFNIEVPQ